MFNYMRHYSHNSAEWRWVRTAGAVAAAGAVIAVNTPIEDERQTLTPHVFCTFYPCVCLLQAHWPTLCCCSSLSRLSPPIRAPRNRIPPFPPSPLKTRTHQNSRHAFCSTSENTPPTHTHHRNKTPSQYCQSYWHHPSQKSQKMPTCTYLPTYLLPFSVPQPASGTRSKGRRFELRSLQAAPFFRTR